MLDGSTDEEAFSRCSWCNDFLGHNPDDNINEAICALCRSELASVPNFSIDTIPQEFVDSLPFGNIVLDPDNRIIRYNATEAEYTGYQSSKIEGKNFFDEVAPCTRVSSFYGKLQDFKDNCPLLLGFFGNGEVIEAAG